MTKIFFGGFPLDTTELEIVQLVSLHGQVETIKIVRDKQTKKCKGYAFLEMKSREDADAAIDALDGAVMGDRVLKVSVAPDKPAAKPFRPASFVRVGRPSPPSSEQRARRPRK